MSIYSLTEHFGPLLEWLRHAFSRRNYGAGEAFYEEFGGRRQRREVNRQHDAKIVLLNSENIDGADVLKRQLK